MCSILPSFEGMTLSPLVIVESSASCDLAIVNKKVVSGRMENPLPSPIEILSEIKELAEPKKLIKEIKRFTFSDEHTMKYEAPSKFQKVKGMLGQFNKSNSRFLLNVPVAVNFEIAKRENDPAICQSAPKRIKVDP